MNEADSQKQDDGTEPKAFFFYIAQRIVSALDVATGAEIKAMIKAAVRSFDPAHTLVLEGHGREPDRIINDNETVSLLVGHHEKPKDFYTKPPTNFGGA